MVPFASDLEYREGINRMIEQIRKDNQGQEAPHMPIMPEEVDIPGIEQFKNPGIDVYVGLETENVTLEGIDVVNSPVTILGNAGSGKTNLLRVFLHQLEGKAEVTIFDAPNRELKDYERKEGIRVIKNMDQFVAFMDDLEREVVQREAEVNSQPPDMEEEIVRRMRPSVVMIDDLSAFYSRQTTSEKEIAEMFIRAAAAGILMIATNPLSKFYGSDPVTEFFKRAPYGVLVSPQGHLNVAPVDLVPGMNEGVLYKKSRAVMVRIPKA